VCAMAECLRSAAWKLQALHLRQGVCSRRVCGWSRSRALIEGLRARPAPRVQHKNVFQQISPYSGCSSAFSVAASRRA
jgi:hypothetical protein